MANVHLYHRTNSSDERVFFYNYNSWQVQQIDRVVEVVEETLKGDVQAL